MWLSLLQSLPVWHPSNTCFRNADRFLYSIESRRLGPATFRRGRAHIQDADWHLSLAYEGQSAKGSDDIFEGQGNVGSGSSLAWNRLE